ncbi:hypothetical protein HQN64_05065 [Enterobacteriaceae bacterium BIT-l23]|uniref:hypothetical protein n=1 Tax=Jejubacter sp. L23 TaxID=3092086 RepID=UPI001584C787|nr:hypothetical protein [Enterobacteriaceae bacterium BIT-l23]
MNRNLPPRTRYSYESPGLSKEQVVELLHLKLQLDNVIKNEKEMKSGMELESDWDKAIGRERNNTPEQLIDGLEVASFILETTVNQETRRLCNLKAIDNWEARMILHYLPDVVKDKINSYLTEACMRLEDYIIYYKNKRKEI